MSESREATKDTTNNEKGGSAPVAGSEDQKKRDLQRIAELLDNASTAFLGAVMGEILRACEKPVQIKIVLNAIDSRMSPEKVGKLLIAWEHRLAEGAG